MPVAPVIMRICVLLTLLAVSRLNGMRIKSESNLELMAELDDEKVVARMKSLHTSNQELGIGNCYYYDARNWTNLEIFGLDLEEKTPEMSDKQMKWFQRLGVQARARKKPALRAEYRTLSYDERLRFHSAMWKLRDATFEDGASLYDTFTILHQPKYSAQGVRVSPAQYGWHREYLLRFEQALINIDSSVTLPYWDLSLDVYLPDVGDSLIWDIEMMGPCGGSAPSGVVTEGSFGYFPVSEAIQNATRDAFGLDSSFVTRACSSSEAPVPFTDTEIVAAFVNVTTMDDFQSRECLVKDHDQLHGLVGGTTRGDVSGVIADPISWIMHGFIDFVWEVFRQDAQESDPASDYASSDKAMFDANYTMNPFYALTNFDGISNTYTEELYVYQAHAVNCLSHSDCGSEALFCGSSIGRCQSKLKEGGKCLDLGGSDACITKYCSADLDSCEWNWLGKSTATETATEK